MKTIQIEKDYFIGKNIEKYVEIMDDDLFSRDELLAILTWQISDALKITLLGFTDEENINNRKELFSYCMSTYSQQ